MCAALVFRMAFFVHLELEMFAGGWQMAVGGEDPALGNVVVEILLPPELESSN